MTYAKHLNGYDLATRLSQADAAKVITARAAAVPKIKQFFTEVLAEYTEALLSHCKTVGGVTLDTARLRYILMRCDDGYYYQNCPNIFGLGVYSRCDEDTGFKDIYALGGVLCVEYDAQETVVDSTRTTIRTINRNQIQACLDFAEHWPTVVAKSPNSWWLPSPVAPAVSGITGNFATEYDPGVFRDRLDFIYVLNI